MTPSQPDRPTARAEAAGSPSDTSKDPAVTVDGTSNVDPKAEEGKPKPADPTGHYGPGYGDPTTPPADANPTPS
jgi:hypothetical protein